MLRRLRIQNLAIVENVEIEFGAGLNVLTGETGAGKSIVLDALLLLGGARSSSSDVRAGSKMASLEATIEIPDPSFKTLLENRGIILEDSELHLRRIIQSDGKSKVFMNDHSVTVGTLQECAKFWLDITGQHAQQLLKDPIYQLKVIDQFGGLQAELEAYQLCFANAVHLHQEILEIRQNKEKWQRDREYFEYQLKDLQAADLQAGELERLELDSKRISNLEKLSNSVKSAQQFLDGDLGILELLGKLNKEVHALQKIDASLNELSVHFSESELALQNISSCISLYSEKLESDPNEIESINQRISMLQTLARKFGSIDNAISLRDELIRKLQLVENSSIEESERVQKFTDICKTLVMKDTALKQKRESACASLGKIVVEELKHLGMASSLISIPILDINEGTFEIDSRWYGAMGSTRVQFLFSANPGVPLHPLEKIASGGEFSRVLLAIKALSMKSERFMDVKVYVFDEVDSGIGGPTAERVGLRMKALSHKGQVLCVTHLAQVACYADTHFNVEKTVAKGKTLTTVKQLSKVERKSELARMIGGLKITENVLEHARELLHRGMSTLKV